MLFHPVCFRLRLQMSLKYPNRPASRAIKKIFGGADIENGTRTGANRLFDLTD
ncbi:hypothetical protein [Rhizobium sp. UGM030330-04]|uniref:hypothetical protein n=1 Tax=Rhizobium sp. UGM030330-04 TaxID=1378077 RepID=UPI0015E8DD2C|nr:hypothetical protein [Rhizobium sp. UGM030330-04]